MKQNLCVVLYLIFIFLASGFIAFYSPIECDEVCMKEYMEE
jgi:hypothetical protein